MISNFLDDQVMNKSRLLHSAALLEIVVFKFHNQSLWVLYPLNKEPNTAKSSKITQETKHVIETNKDTDNEKLMTALGSYGKITLISCH